MVITQVNLESLDEGTEFYVNSTSGASHFVVTYNDGFIVRAESSDKKRRDLSLTNSTMETMIERGIYFFQNERDALRYKLETSDEIEAGKTAINLHNQEKEQFIEYVIKKAYKSSPHRVEKETIKKLTEKFFNKIEI